jgi:hypothetical protein
MYKIFITEVIARGKVEEDKAFRERAKKILEKHGYPYKVWGVEGRKFGQVYIEIGREFKSRVDFEAARDKVLADKE